MISRVNRYYQHPASQAFLDHMIQENGFCELDQKIIRNLRQFSGDTALHAQAAGITEKEFNRRTGAIGMRMVEELLRLAEIGYNYEKSTR